MTPHAGEHRPRVTFIVEQHIGLKTVADNLRRVIDRDSRIETTWWPVTYVRDEGWIERLPLIPSGLKGTLRGVVQARAGCRRQPADARFFLTQVPAVLAGRAARKRPFVFMADDTPLLFDQMSAAYGTDRRSSRLGDAVKQWINTRTFRRAARIFPYSQWAADSFHHDYGVAPDRIEVLAIGVDLELWKPARPPSSDELQILFVGSDFERKGGHDLLAAFATLPPGMAHLHLVTGADIAEQARVSVHRGLTANSEPLIQLFQSCDLFVLPSHGEAFGQVLVEAIATGMPAVVTKMGAMPEIIVDGECGFVIPVGDREMLAAKLRWFAEHPDERRVMGEAARRHAEKCFDSVRNAARIVEALVTLAG